MTLANVKLIFAREVRDQLRDRRTLFMIAVLPILLYPLLGVSFFQISQFMQEQVTRVLVIGGAEFRDQGPGVGGKGSGGRGQGSGVGGQGPEARGKSEGAGGKGDGSNQTDGTNRINGTNGTNASSPIPRPSSLFEGDRFSPRFFLDASRARLMELHFAPDDSPSGQSAAERRSEAQTQVQLGTYEAAIYFPSDFAFRLEAFRKAIRESALNPPTRPGPAGKPVVRTPAAAEMPTPEIIYNTASDKSKIAYASLSDVLARWKDQIGNENLEASGISVQAARPFVIGVVDVANPERRAGRMWSKILPVMLLLWALTGAFYPAIDLCAGEKERGTLETLLSSPAQRSEIVVGKLITIMLFSAVTAVLNMVSVGITGGLMASRLVGFDPPPPTAVIALGIALLPIAALFSALCLALAAFARSTKEGQYYLMPLLLITMPLVILPMAPGVELNLGNSLIPVTGVVLLLRSVLEGEYWQALRFSPVVATVTLLACLMSIRWAVDQFNRESVLFRESERLDVRLWMRHVVRDRQSTPTVAAGLCCGVLILVLHFFLSLLQAMPTDFSGLVRTFLLPQLAVIGPVTLLMTFVCTTSPRQTLLLRMPRWPMIAAAALLAVALHPASRWLQVLVQQLYPVSESVQPSLLKIDELLRHSSLLPLLLLIGIIPPVFEELAFRGFILSGFRHFGHKWRAIAFSAVLFGLTHGVIQQSLIASLLGALIAYLAIQTGSILPGMVFHMIHNSLAVANSRITPEVLGDSRLINNLLSPTSSNGCMFAWYVATAGAAVGLLVLIWFARLPGTTSPEESLEAAIEQSPAERLTLAKTETAE